MTPKKPYQKRLPKMPPPAPRRAPKQEAVRPRPSPPRARRTLPAVPPPDRPQAAPPPRELPDRPSDAAPGRTVEPPQPSPDATPDSRSSLTGLTGLPAAKAAESASPAAPWARAVPPWSRSASRPTPGAPPPGPRRRTDPPSRRTLWLVAAGVVGVLAGAVLTRYLWQPGTQDQQSVVPPAASVPLDAWPPAGEARTVTVINPNASLDVTHWISAERPIEQITLTLPPGASADPSQVVRASDLAVSVDDRSVAGPDSINREAVSYFLPDEATHVQVRYQLTGVVRRSASVEGRGLATATAVEMSTTPRRETRVVRAQGVLSLACEQQDAPSRAPIPCGTPDSDNQWSVDLEGPDVGARVLASVTLS